MKRFSSPLIWLCLVCALALSALALADPSGIYGEYRAKLPPGRPAIAAVFTAAEHGVYPWSKPKAPPEPPADDPPAVKPPEDTPPAVEPPVPDQPDPPVDPAPTVPPEPVQPEPAPPEKPEFITVDKSYFDDALFLGDSHIEGFSLFAGVPNATYYFQRGLTVWSVLTKDFVDGPRGKQTLSQALADQQFGKIYVLLGINELGDDTAEVFAEQYGVVINVLRELQPDAVIYIQAIFHTTQEKSETSRFKNEIINERNEAIAQLADGEHVFFVDCNPLFDDETGALPPELTGDGVHIQAPYYARWRDYLCNYGLAGK